MQQETSITFKMDKSDEGSFGQPGVELEESCTTFRVEKVDGGSFGQPTIELLMSGGLSKDDLESGTESESETEKESIDESEELME